MRVDVFASRMDPFRVCADDSRHFPKTHTKIQTQDETHSPIHGAQAATHPLNIMPVWLSTSRHNSPVIHPFPKHLLAVLSNKPSVRTNAVAAALLHSAGVPVSPKLMRMSVCEAIGKLMECPGVWLGGVDGVGAQGRGEGTRHASECLARLVRARDCIPRAWDARAKADAHVQVVDAVRGKTAGRGRDGEGRGASDAEDDEDLFDDEDDDDDDVDEVGLEGDAWSKVMERERREKARQKKMLSQQDRLMKARAAGQGAIIECPWSVCMFTCICMSCVVLCCVVLCVLSSLVLYLCFYAVCVHFQGKKMKERGKVITLSCTYAQRKMYGPRNNA